MKIIIINSNLFLKQRKKNIFAINNLKILNEKLINCMNNSLDDFFD